MDTALGKQTDVTAKKIQNPKQQNSCGKSLQGGQPQSPRKKDSQVSQEWPHLASSLFWYLGSEVMLTWFVVRVEGNLNPRDKAMEESAEQPHLGILNNKGKNKQELLSSWALGALLSLERRSVL